ncbi:hypothetical protein BDV95DRAFT_569864 [Massariosphaeria phaeospora]|uniref:K Homology domain-containing protein n=1 Tax=Massariosphaeria phaeospora TaxID=100035 RepID=A0A7C8M973_9PLEO|nr:hypothetical protein BDV95DRAFT_569864 [Massariosphaeria phaeospora]
MTDGSRQRSRFDRDGSDRPSRARFDRDDSDRPSRSRFDRRSRSPSSRGPDARRARSPVKREPSLSPATVEAQQKKSSAAAAAAAAAAARINAQIQAKKAAMHVDVPPIRTVASPVVKSPSTNPGTAVPSETYQQDGDYIKDIEINDLRNRYTLTKGAVQKQIKDDTGADVTTRGNYYPDKSMATAINPPLYLHVTSTSKEGLEQAIQMITEMMQQELPNLVDERRFRRREPEAVERDELGRRKWPEEKIPVDLEPINGFNLRAQVVGRSGDNVKFIQQETGCKVQIKGHGSGFVESLTGRESDEPMYLHIAGPRPEGVEAAKVLSVELLEKVRADYHAFKERPPQSRFGGGGDDYPNGRRGYGERGERGGRGDRGDRGYRGDRTRDHGDRSEPEPNLNYGYENGYGGASGYGAQHDVQTPAMDTNAQATDYNAQWAAYYASNPAAAGAAGTGEDPYAAYGGYEAYLVYYQQWQQQSQQYYATAQQSPGAAAVLPSPSQSAPPGVAAPPGANSTPGTYQAVPPPPGL